MEQDHGITKIVYYPLEGDNSFIGIARVHFYRLFEIYPVRVYRENDKIKVKLPSSVQRGKWRNLFHPVTAEGRTLLNKTISNHINEQGFEKSQRVLTSNMLEVRHRFFDGRDGLTGFGDITIV